MKTFDEIFALATSPLHREYAETFTDPRLSWGVGVTQGVAVAMQEMQAEIDALKAQNAELLAAQQWRDIESAPKRITILLLFKGGSGKHRIVMACYYPPNTLPADEDSDDEYAPEGWYEECEFGDYVHGIVGDLVGWMPVPKAIAKARGESCNTF